MNLAKLFENSILISRPPPGAVNVRLGNAVDGPGGRWVPCASAIDSGVFVSCVFEIGSGRHQVCAANFSTRCADEALLRASELAATAAA